MNEAQKNLRAAGARKDRRAARWRLVATLAAIVVALPASVFVLYGLGWTLVTTVSLYGVDLGSPWRALYVAAWHVFALSMAAGAVSIALGKQRR
jgi:hypothetical protein